MFSLLTIFFLAAPGALAVIVDEYSCTNYVSYNNLATACFNALPDSTCAIFYRDTGAGFPAPGNSVARPIACYSTNPLGGSVDIGMRNAAIQNCAKTCGMCCLTPAYNCPNAPFPDFNCATIQQSQCTSPIWRERIALNCPSACGFCNEGGCVDAVTNCGNDISICTNINMQTFVNQYCKRTCGRCSSQPGGLPGGGCITYPADTVTTCRAWANNGFCTNEFYKDQWRVYCGTTCKKC